MTFTIWANRLLAVGLSLAGAVAWAEHKLLAIVFLTVGSALADWNGRMWVWRRPLPPNRWVDCELTEKAWAPSRDGNLSRARHPVDQSGDGRGRAAAGEAVIQNTPIDGSCFKLTVLLEDPYTHGPARRYEVWGEDEDELWAHYVEVRHGFLRKGIVTMIEIRDDSK